MNYDRYSTQHTATYHDVVYALRETTLGSIESLQDIDSFRRQLSVETLITSYKMLDIIIEEPFFVTAVNAYHPPVLASRYSAYGYVDLSEIEMDEREDFIAASDYQVWLMENEDISSLNKHYLACYSLYIDRLRHHKDSYFLIPQSELKRIEAAIDAAREVHGLQEGSKWHDLINSIVRPIEGFGPDEVPF